MKDLFTTTMLSGTCLFWVPKGVWGFGRARMECAKSLNQNNVIEYVRDVGKGPVAQLG